MIHAWFGCHPASPKIITSKGVEISSPRKAASTASRESDAAGGAASSPGRRGFPTMGPQPAQKRRRLLASYSLVAVWGSGVEDFQVMQCLRPEQVSTAFYSQDRKTQVRAHLGQG